VAVAQLRLVRPMQHHIVVVCAVLAVGACAQQFDKDVLLLPHRLVAEYVLPAAGVRGATVSVNFQ
jgi:hypothetical protein